MPGDYSADFARIDAQVDELEKIALGAGWGRAIGGVLSAGVGGTAGYMTAPPELKTQRAVKGALIGGLAGIAGGQAATKAGRLQATQFGQRQLHGATGYLPGRGIFGTKGAPLTSEGRIGALEGIGWKVPKKIETTGVGKITPTTGAVEKAVAEKGPGGFITKHFRGGRLDKARTKAKLRAQAAQRLLAEEGLTSLPGLAKGYATGTANLGRAGVLKANLLAPGAALGVGLPLAFAAPGAIESAQTGSIRPAVRGLVESAGYTIGGGLPLAASLGLGTGVSTVAGRLLRSRPLQQPAGQLAAGMVR